MNWNWNNKNNFKYKTEQGNQAKSTWYYPSTNVTYSLHLPVHHLPHYNNTSPSTSEMKENRKNCVWNMSINYLGLSIKEHVV